MIASPSRPGHRLSEDENENYYFQWPRDGSMCLRVVVDRMMRAEIGEVVSLNEESAKDIERRIRESVISTLCAPVMLLG